MTCRFCSSFRQAKHTDVESPYQNPALYLISASNVLVYCVTAGLLMVSGQSWWNYSLNTIKPMQLSGVGSNFVGAVATLQAICLMIVVYFMQIFGAENFSNALRNQLSSGLIIWIFLVAIYPVFISAIFLSSLIKFFQPLLQFRGEGK